MAHSDKSLDVLVRILTEQVGSEKAQDILAQIKAQAAGATGTMGKLGRQLAKTDEKTQQFSSHGREMYLLFGQLNRLVPDLGDSLRSLNVIGINPVIGLLAVLALAFYESKKALDDWNKSLDDSAKAAADPMFLDGIQARIEVLDAAKTAAQEYAEKEAAIAANEQSISTALQNQLQYMAAIEQARGAQTQAQKALALARVGQAETEGKITPSQAIEQRAGVEKEFGAREFAEKQQAAADKYQTDQLNLFAGRQAQKLLDFAKSGADLRATQADAKFKQAQADVKQNYSTQADTDKAMKPLEDAVTAAQRRVREEEINVSRSGLMPEQNALDKAALASAQQQLENAQKAAEGMQDHIRQLQRESGESAKQSVDALKHTAELADKKAQEGLDAIAKLQNQVDEQGKILAGTGPLSQSTQQTQQTTIETKETTDLEKQARADIEKYGRDINSGNLRDALAVLQDLQKALSGHAQVLAYVTGLGFDVRRLDAAQRELEREMRDHSVRMENHGP